MATYLDAINNVFRRLREPAVSSVNDSDYSAMLGVYVNDAKREIEDAHDWNILSKTVNLTTMSSTSKYTLAASQLRFRVNDVLNTTSKYELSYMTLQWANRQFFLTVPQNSKPSYYTFNGVDTNGDTQVDLYPVPDAAYNIMFTLTVPQVDLALDADKILVPVHLVSLLAYSKAIAERGEDGGVQSSEAYQMYRLALADAIAIERNHYEEQVSWVGI